MQKYFGLAGAKILLHPERYLVELSKSNQN